MSKIKEYINSEVTIIWEAEKCVHSAICTKALPQVFRPRAKPWIKMDVAKTEEIINQVKACPSGTLRFYRNKE